MQPTTKVKLHIPVSLKLLKIWRSSFISDYVESPRLSGNLHERRSQYDTPRPAVGSDRCQSFLTSVTHNPTLIFHNLARSLLHDDKRVISLALAPCGLCQIYLETFLLRHQIRREEREVAFPMLPIGDSHQYLKEQ